jgi:hypothetical protein
MNSIKSVIIIFFIFVAVDSLTFAQQTEKNYHLNFSDTVIVIGEFGGFSFMLPTSYLLKHDTLKTNYQNLIVIQYRWYLGWSWCDCEGGEKSNIISDQIKNVLENPKDIGTQVLYLSDIKVKNDNGEIFNLSKEYSIRFTEYYLNDKKTVKSTFINKIMPTFFTPKHN